MSSSPVSIDNGKADCCGRSSPGGSADGIAEKSTTPELAIQNDDPTTNKNDADFVESSHSAPNGTVPALCNHTIGGENVTDKGRGLSDKTSSNAERLQFSVGPDAEINLIVDLNCTPSTWYTNKYSEDMSIRPSTRHSESGKFSKIIVSLVNRDDHNMISTPSNTISRPSAAALPGTLVEVPESQEGIQVLPSSLLNSDVQYDIKPDTMAGALDDKALPPENVVISVRSERSNAPLTDGSVQPTGSAAVMSQDKTKNSVNISSTQNVSIDSTDKVVAFPQEDVVRIDSNENTLKESAVKQKTVDVPAGAPHNIDIDEVPVGYVPVEKVEMEEGDIGCGDRLPDSQLDVCVEDSYDPGNFDLTNTTPSCAALEPGDDLVIKNNDLGIQNKKVSGKSGGITNIQFSDLRILQKTQDEIVHRHHMLGDLSAQADMDIQTILNEGEMTQKVKSIMEKYKKEISDIMELANSSYSGEGRRNMSLKRRRLKEGILVRNKCQELHEICRDNNWILPIYNVIPSKTDGLCHATVSLFGPDFEMRTDGDLKNNPREARESAAADMICQLHQIAEEERRKSKA